MVRSVREVSGYVVTGERDTPISTAGLWDDRGRERFPSAELRAFNDDLAVLVGGTGGGHGCLAATGLRGWSHGRTGRATRCGRI